MFATMRGRTGPYKALRCFAPIIIAASYVCGAGPAFASYADADAYCHQGPRNSEMSASLGAATAQIEHAIQQNELADERLLAVLRARAGAAQMAA